MDIVQGLSSKEVLERQKIFGSNDFKKSTSHKEISLLLRQFTSPIILILIAATLISIAVGDKISGLIILGIIIPSGLLGYWQEHRADKIMQSLLAQIAINAEVMRDGVEVTVPVTELVPGDCLILRVGDLIPADSLVSESKSLLVDESVLTGESFPREVSASDLIFQGSHIVAGQGSAVITTIGEGTKFGKIVHSATRSQTTTGFERGLTKFGTLILRSVASLVTILFLINLLLHRPVIESILFSLALAVGLTPQLLPVITSVSLSVGARQMAKRKVLVKRLDAIEDLGSMTILCTDKTGTLTTGDIRLVAAINLNGIDDPRVLRLAFLNSSLQSGFINPIDTAVIQAVGNKDAKSKLISEVSYDFTRRRLSVLTSEEGGLLITKGAHKEVVTICTHARVDGQVIPIESASKQIEERFETLTRQGHRVISVASKPLLTTTPVTVNDESQMVFEGFLSLEDPPKIGVAGAIDSLGKQGVTLYLITGDNRFAAELLANQVGLKGKVLTGEDIAGLSTAQLAEKIMDVRVFAAIDPLQKEAIVKALKFDGSTVGYFGDGINDAPALHAADVGISVDTGVDVAKSVASIVLLEKDLAVLSEGIKLGRKTFINTLKYIRVGVSAAFGNVVSMAIADIFLPFLPLLPAQILLLNFMTDFPAVTISGDSVDEESLQKPTHWDVKLIKKLMIIFGLISTLFDLATFATLKFGFNAGSELFRTGWFVESAFTELAVLMVLRTNRRFWKSAPGKGLLISSLLLAIVALAIPFTGFGATIGFVPLPMSLVLSLMGLIAIYISINEFAKKFWWK